MWLSGDSALENGERAVHRGGERLGIIVSEDIALPVGSLVNAGATRDGVGGWALPKYTP